MSTSRPASETIIAEVGSWPGIEVDTGEIGEVAFKLGRREIGHVHGDAVAHLSFPKQTWHELYEEGRIGYHPVFPGKTGPAAREIRDDADVQDVIALFRMVYERVLARRGTSPERAA
jgi:hypothetical protein